VGGSDLRTFGYSRDAALGRDLAELIIPPELRERHRQGMARYLATGRGPLLGKRVQLEGMRADGSRISVELAMAAVLLRGSQHFTAYLRDITERLRTEVALREIEHRLRATYELAFVGIGEVNADGRFLRVNEQLCLITGYSRTELLARTFWKITHLDDRGPDLEQFSHQVAGDLQVYRLEKRYIHKDGHPVWVKLAASSVDDGAGHLAYGIRVARDVTECKKAEQCMRLLINELNHRVKNSLATVQSIAAQTLRNAPTRSEASAAIEQRLFALSRTHDVLTRENWEGAYLTEIIS
jgi:PAS domain S-box-containing protein